MITVAIALTVVAQPQLAKLGDTYNLQSVNDREAINEYSAFWLNVLEPSSPKRA
jgi:hypothetical protein